MSYIISDPRILNKHSARGLSADVAEFPSIKVYKRRLIGGPAIFLKKSRVDLSSPFAAVAADDGIDDLGQMSLPVLRGDDKPADAWQTASHRP